MANPLQFAYRTQKAIGVFDAAPVYEALPGFEKPEGNLRCCVYSPCGRYFAYASNEGVVVADASVGHVLTALPIANAFELGFSPRGNYLSTWERPAKDENGDATKNLKIWRTIEDVADGDEKEPLGNNDFSTVWNKLRAEGVTDFAIAPGLNQNVAVFIPERKGQPAAVKVYNVPSFASPISQKTFFKGDKVQLKWNALGTSLITKRDQSMTLPGLPTSTEFGRSIYGFMPAKTTILQPPRQDHPLVPDRSSQHHHLFSSRGLVHPGGLGDGNLAGQMDVYDLEKQRVQICTHESGNPSVCTWSPDSRYIMTATTSPRLRVDNGIKLWHVGGGIMYNEDMVELYNAMWRPIPAENLPAGDPLHPVPTPHASGMAFLGTVKTPSKPVGAYRPPGARGALTPLHFKREDEGGAAHIVSNGTASVGPNGFGRPRHLVPGAEPASRSVPGAAPVDEGNAAKKNKKKRNKKAKEGDAAATAANGSPTEGGLAPSPREYGSASGNEGRSPDRRGQQHARSRSRQNNGPRNRTNAQRGASRNRPSQAGQGGGSPVSPATPGDADGAGGAGANPNAKKVRALQKKIRAIEDLEMRLAGGEKLEETQVKKINTKKSVVDELAALGEHA
ncbi:hypothetical protein CHGG_09731 [Chaetomium globosum CBS 148.51]|uniref:Translation initiation factor beta propellor-like domain-containing protein n=1 Tax=Chaetomium globosum (strain ATCC 6205 / CBS 148.51 / DSM 1962 / NBRC 6347 / NRRL 1970) TaxID=306901 RepID=Q2GQM3_CHAGB|nr:uncharacterized protein CHGG_09731 [Chaetomium globosum CBS 148.51]EAQ83327.1 hypothetical protein CHGG_09731 [Chaetomium globosum CBS 148.51]